MAVTTRSVRKAAKVKVDKQEKKPTTDADKHDNSADGGNTTCDASYSYESSVDSDIDVEYRDTRVSEMHDSVLDQLPEQLSQGRFVGAALSLFGLGTLFVLTLHGLSICPDWALPIGWIAMAAVLGRCLTIGIDCANGSFVPVGALNSIIGTLILCPVIQPLAFWQQFSRDQSRRGWLASAARGHASIVTSLISVSSVVLVAVVGSAATFLLQHLGLVFIVRMYVIPFVLYNAWTSRVFSAANSLWDRSASMPHVWGRRVGFCVRAHLWLHRRVPSYRRREACGIVQRMWNRTSMSFSLVDHNEALRAAQDLKRKGFSSHGLAQHFNESDDVEDSLTTGYMHRDHIWSSSDRLEALLSKCLIPLISLWLYVFVRYHDEVSLRDLQLTHLVNSSSDVKTAILDKVQYLWSVRSSLVATVRSWSVWYQVAQGYATLANLGIVTAIVLVLIALAKWRKQRPVFLVDFTTFVGAEKNNVSSQTFRDIQRHFPFKKDSLDFMFRLLERTGLGEKTYFPDGTLTDPPQLNIRTARQEAETVIFNILDQLFHNTKTNPKDIDILIVNCSLFCPTPSLASMIVNKYGMREDIDSYNLGGMGCSAGVIAIHLGKQLLQSRPNANCVVVSTENITQNWYHGNEKGMLLSNCLFRMGGAAIMLTNKHSQKHRAKYQLLHSIRTHRGRSDLAYNAVYQDTDADGNLGVRLSKKLMGVAGDALKRNITTLGPLVLPMTEQLKFGINLVQRKFLGRKIKSYMPNFKKAIQHFCIHAGGRAVVDAIEESLSLSESDCEASRHVLHRYGNTSSSSIWYELAYLEKAGRINKTDKVWQIAFGSGFKCNSAVWQAI